jgi:hypothetical protein
VPDVPRTAVLRPVATAESQGMDSQRHGEDEAPSPMRLLAAGVPLSLLMDLACPHGPDSEGIAATERAGRR